MKSEKDLKLEKLIKLLCDNPKYEEDIDFLTKQIEKFGGLQQIQLATNRYADKFKHMTDSVVPYLEKKGFSDIKFEEKKVGAQLGFKILAKDKNNKDVKYHVKTYNGHSGSEGMDPREPFVYKVLENVGVGPKVEFIRPSGSRSFDGYYIATLDMAHTKKDNKQKTFLPYEKEEGEKKYNALIDGDENFAAQHAVIEILNASLNLRDSFTNKDNFGLTISKNNNTGAEKPSPKLIDFSNTGGSYDKLEGKSQFAGMINNERKGDIYLQAIKLLCNGDGKKMSFDKAMSNAFDFVQKLTKDPFLNKEDLTSYKKLSLEKFESICKQLQDKYINQSRN